MTLRELAELDCINAECPLWDKCSKPLELYAMGLCDMAQEPLKVVEEEG